jgi:hypothetical protein
MNLIKNMHRVLIVLLVVLVLVRSESMGQANGTCETVYKTVDNNPIYEGGVSALMDYFQKSLIPIINKSVNKEMTTKLLIMLTIDSNGKVTDVILSRHMLSKDSEEQLRKKILTMSGWAAGRIKGQNVCCNYAWIIGCIKWG